jgi:hypothetical protein
VVVAPSLRPFSLGLSVLCKRRQFRNDGHGFALKRRPSVEVARQSRCEGLPQCIVALVACLAKLEVRFALPFHVNGGSNFLWHLIL